MDYRKTYDVLLNDYIKLSHATIISFKDEISDFAQEAIYTIDFNDPDSAIKPKDSSINLDVTPYVIIKVFKALKNNDFPEYLDYCA
ncbi:MAG TPA: hypothetical protein VGT41_01175 [Candidatus Babeliales bacterium]|nr:hypothetical protein [Candidatus Babeliales bacterium]